MFSRRLSLEKSTFSKMVKTEQRAVIKFLHMKGMKGADTFEELKNVLGESALSYATVNNRVAEFKHAYNHSR